MKRNEIKIVARGLRPPGPLLMVKKKLKEIELDGNLRIIVSSKAGADELMDYFKDQQADLELDRAGDDYHIIVNLNSLSSGGE